MPTIVSPTVYVVKTKKKRLVLAVLSFHASRLQPRSDKVEWSHARGTQKHSIHSSKISKNAKIHQNISPQNKSINVPKMNNNLYHSPPILYLKKSLLNLPPVALQI
jgi:hypothetical protein